MRSHNAKKLFVWETLLYRIHVKKTLFEEMLGFCCLWCPVYFSCRIAFTSSKIQRNRTGFGLNKSIQNSAFILHWFLHRVIYWWLIYVLNIAHINVMTCNKLTNLIVLDTLKCWLLPILLPLVWVALLVNRLIFLLLFAVLHESNQSWTNKHWLWYCDGA